MFYKILKTISAPSLGYVTLRYITYILQFLNAILLARCFGEYDFGVYSFMILIISYMQYSNLGINDSLNTEYAINKSDKIKATAIWDNAWTVNFLINIVLGIVCTVIFLCTDNLFTSYHFNEYRYALLGTCIIMNLSKIYTTYYRLNGKLVKINIQQILPNLTVFILLLIYWNDLSVSAITTALLISNAIALVIFRIGLPRIPKFSLNKTLSFLLIKRGITLLLYNLSFYLLTVIASSIVSIFYSVETFGYYSFANTLVNGVVTAGGAFMFIFYPKILNRLNTDSVAAVNLIQRIREVYIVFMDVISLVSILFVIVLTAILPQYGSAMVIMYSILILGRIINNASSGYATLLIAQGKENHLVRYGFLSVLFVGVSGIFIHYGNLSVEYIAISVAIASFLYTFLVVNKALCYINGSRSFSFIFREIFGMNKWLACLIIIFNVFLFRSYAVLITCVFIYMIINMQNIKKSWEKGLSIITDKNSLSF